MFNFVKDHKESCLDVNIYSSNWICKLKDKKLKDIHIPGTHDSACYTVSFTKSSELYKSLRPLFYYLGYISCVTIHFTKTQSLNIYKQLCIGVRYLDLRICYYPLMTNQCEFLCSHTYYCTTLKDIIDQINKFTEENPEELIVIRYAIDFEHFSSTNIPDIHKYLRNNLNKVNASTSDIYADINVIADKLISDLLPLGNVLLFPNLETQWFNVNNVTDFTKLYRDYTDKLFVLDAVVTPNEKSNFLYGLYSLSRQVKKEVLNNFKSNFNVYSLDYIDKELCNFVISKNFE